MGTIAANAQFSEISDHILGDVVSRRRAPLFFENDYIKIVLPILQESDVAAAGVLDDEGRLCGLLTERGILRHIFAHSPDRLMQGSNVKKYIDDMTVADVMIRNPETLPEDMSIEEAAEVMLRRGYRFMPVVSRFDKTKPVGIVGEREIASLLRQMLHEVKAKEMEHKSLLSYMLREPYGIGFHPAEAP